MHSSQQRPGYTGIQNLEVMAEAHKYNTWLGSEISAHVRPGAKVLDFGAGSGTFADQLGRQGAEVTCIEPDLQLQEILRDRGMKVLSALTELPDGCQFDLVYSLNVLEHIENDRAALRAIAAKVRPGGTLFIYVPAFAVLFSAMDRRVGHFRRYRLGELKLLVQGAGLQVTRAEYVDSIGFAATPIYRIFGDRSGEINRSTLRLYDCLVFPISRKLDILLRRIVGKNVLVIARQPE